MDGKGRCAYTAESWNEWFPPGTRVVLVEDNGDRLMTRTGSEAWALENGHPVVQVEGKVGGYSLARIKPLSDWKALRAKSERDLLLDAVKLAYRKHVRGDEEIGWTELEEALYDALVQAMGAEGFLAWNDEGGGE